MEMLSLGIINLFFSDLQAYLLEERDHVLRLYAENDRLKIKEIDDKRKISHLLALAGPAAEECSYFLKDPPHMVSDIQQIKPDSKNQTQFSDRGNTEKITDKYQKPEPKESKNIVIKQASGVTVIEPSRAKQPPGPKNSGTRVQRNGKKKDKSKYGHMDDREILVLQVEALQSQLEEQTRLARDQIAALTEDRKILSDEKENSANRDKVKISSEKIKIYFIVKMISFYNFP